MEYVLTIIKWPSFEVKRLLAFFGAGARHLHDHFIPHPRNNYHPHILGHRALALFSVMLVSMKIFTLTILSLGPVLPVFSSAITQENIIALTNESRKAYGLKELTQNNLLAVAAQAKADDMLARGYFSHNTPDGRTPWSFIETAGYSYIMAGENLAVNFTEAENVETAWMNSPGHKANILNKNFEEIGIGISQGQYQGHTAIFVVQMFGTPIAQKLALSDKPTIVQTQEVPVPPVLSQQAVNSAATQTPASQTAPSLENILQPVAVQSGEVAVAGNSAVITATTTDSAVKVIAYFGQQAIMLQPKGQGQWEGQADLGKLAAGQAQVRIKAFDMAGKTAELQLADFSSSTVKNYNVLQTAKPDKVSWLGRAFDPKVFEQKFYLLFIAVILTSMVLAIGIRRHVQHLSLIANSSFVVILATLLWMTG
ncbi:MAG: CAP domain-containing protein [Patescibacteria group bacterium]|nr:CAP domain-containing protein [Patescibacteria group bacterium]